MVTIGELLSSCEMQARQSKSVTDRNFYAKTRHGKNAPAADEEYTWVYQA